MVFHRSLSGSKSPHVSRSLLSILPVLSNGVVLMVYTRPPTSKSSSPFNNPFVTVPNAPITIGIIVTFMIHSFFNSIARWRYLSFFSFSFSFSLWSVGTAKSTTWLVLFFLLLLLITMRSGLLAEIRGSVCLSKFQSSLCVSFPRTAARLGIYHLFVWSNLNFMHISQSITLPTLSCLVLFSFCANMLHSLIMWLIVSIIIIFYIILFDLVGLFGTSTIVGYLMSNLLYAYILNMICEHILLITFFNEPDRFFLLPVKWLNISI